MVVLHLSNRLEILADRLAAALEPHLSPFRFQTVVVGHRALEFWLRNRFAKRWGIWANVAFPLPARFVWETARKILPEAVPEEDPLSREALNWKIFALLPELLKEPEFGELARYLEQARDRDGQVARFDLAARIADLFDRYQYYRPEWLERIESGEHPRGLPTWQAVLWRRLVETVPTHRIQILRKTTRALYEGRVPEALPERIDWFFVHHQPPRFYDFLYELARHTEIHLWLLSPTDHYWADLRPTKTLLRQRLRHPSAPRLWEVGHELLAAWGREGQALQDLILDRLGTAISREEEHYLPFERRTLLTHIQADIFELKNPDPPRELREEDRSLELHRCHGPLREVQVLHDRLLAAFEEIEGLKPEEVLVLVPDIDRYAPYIEAVFGRRDREIPFHIADTSLPATHPLVQLFFKLLELPESRLSRREVLSLLDLEPIARRFSLYGEPLHRLHHWLEEAGVFWGLDRDHRRTFLEAEAVSEEHTWRHGQRRLLAGFAFGEHPTEKLAPIPQVAGQQAAILGHFWRFLERLAFWREALLGSRPLSAWHELLNRLLDDLFGEETRDPEGHLQAIRDALAEMARLAGTLEIDLPLLRHALAASLSSASPADRFFRKGVAFCGMRPLRGIPFRVIALIGMNEADFPRRERPLEFDAMARRWRHGDPHPGYEDRYLFLETILAARDRLIILFDGRDLRTDDPKPPSLVVEQLLEELDRSYRIAGQKPSAVLLRDHPLQPFSRRNYSGESYDPFWFKVARSIEGQPLQTRIGPSLERWPKRERMERVLLASELERFLSHPVRFFMQRRWRLFLEEAESSGDHEPLEEHPLLSYRIACRLLEAKRSGREVSSSRLREEGLLLGGGLGEALFERIREAVARLWSRLPPGVDFSPATGVLPIFEEKGRPGELLLEYRLSGRWPRGAVAIEPTRRQGRHLLQLWLFHLIWLLHERRGDGESRLILTDGDLTIRTDWSTPEPARKGLNELIQLYLEGCSRPLTILPEASWCYIEKLHRTGDRDAALETARRKLRHLRSRDRQDLYLQRLLPDVAAAIDKPFCHDTERLFGPPIRFAEWSPQTA